MSKLLQIEVEIQNCVEDIKNFFLDNEGIPLRDQVLYFNNRILQNSATLNFYGIGHLDTVHLTSSLMGAGENNTQSLTGKQGIVFGIYKGATPTSLECLPTKADGDCLPYTLGTSREELAQILLNISFFWSSLKKK